MIIKKTRVFILIISLALSGFLFLAGDDFSLEELQEIKCKELLDYADSKSDLIDYSPESLIKVNFTVENGKSSIINATTKLAVYKIYNKTIQKIDLIDDDEGDWTLIDKSICHDTSELTDLYWQNTNKSRAEFLKAITYFKLADDKYTDDYGGAFIDENGIYTICVVGSRKPMESDYLFYKEVDNSYNYLKIVENEIIKKITDFSIWMIGVCESCNKIMICLEKDYKTEELIEYLKEKGIFKKEILNIYIGENGIVLI